MNIRLNIVYLDYTTQRLTSKSLFWREMPSLPHINFQKLTNKNTPFIKVFDIDTKFSKFIKNDVEYYRINLQHNPKMKIFMNITFILILIFMIKLVYLMLLNKKLIEFMT
mgnify:CR=1 FL=1